jgi:aminoglycoside phosphotransferase (APT) family kinase protein
VDEKGTWTRSKGPIVLTTRQAERLVQTGFPGKRVIDLQNLAGGLSNSNFRVQLDSRDEPVVLRIYERNPEACQKEFDLLNHVRRTVPVPDVFHAEPDGLEEVGPFVLMQYVEGITFRQLKRTRDTQALGEAAHSVGKTLAEIGKYKFSKPGDVGAGAQVVGPFIEGPDPLLQFFEQCLADPTFRSRTTEESRGKLHELAHAWAPRMRCLDNERSLVHGDFNSPNILVKQVNGRWEVSAILDWEFAFSGSPLCDVGNFLRYERIGRPVLEPFFSRSFEENGGWLPEGWKRLARIIDLASLCEFLTREMLPADVVIEVLALVQATIEDRDPV